MFVNQSTDASEEMKVTQWFALNTLSNSDRSLYFLSSLFQNSIVVDIDNLEAMISSPCVYCLV